MTETPVIELYVMINSKGHFAIKNGTITHTGDKTDLTFISDINKADLFTFRGINEAMKYKNYKSVVGHLRAYENRVVDLAKDIRKKD